ncbi:MAG: hypothetical protein G8D24_00845 [Buchnera aphidicola (Periphyllus lyropictus)]|uniref:hypothetical protein n=1 Tax=Buchnera aphidicola TaxID=9 RepID=UPI001EB99977|nr:hypothetical protein [Buchnera aphidicola]NIH16600.1 hypothetical protein [Buchnera aphidicola (Periphyllus lyropictus)]USS94490.1 hypothetical protein M5J13_01575 [Buchnera aphidicola (Periphyllus lyropictus)]
MKNKSIFISLLLSGFVTTAHAQSFNHENSFYFGSKINIIKHKVNDNIEKMIDNYQIINNPYKNILIGVYAGYKYSKNFGIEFAYNTPISSRSEKNNLDIRSMFDQNYNIKNEKYLNNIYINEKILKDKEQKKENNGIINKEDLKDIALKEEKKRNNKLNFKKEKINNDILFNKLFEKIKKRNFPIKKNIELSTRFTCPLTSSIDFSTRLGLSLNISKDILFSNLKDKSLSIKNNLFPIFGAGISYQISDNLISTFEFSKKSSFFNEKNYKYDADNSSILDFNITYNFDNIIPKMFKYKFLNKKTIDILQLQKDLEDSLKNFKLPKKKNSSPISKNNSSKEKSFKKFYNYYKKYFKMFIEKLKNNIL